MSNHQILDNITHKDTRVITEHHPDYGDTASYTTITVPEFRHVQAHYPIFFRKNTQTAQFEAIALFGFAEQENLFLDNQGWHANYVPLSIQRRPFLIGFQEKNHEGVIETVPMVHIDMDNPRINETHGEHVFLEQGGQSDYLQKISNILMAIHQGHEESKRFIDILLTHDLIESVNIKVQLNDGSNHELGSLYTINEEKVAALTAETLHDFHQKGYLQAIYMVFASHAKITELIDKKNNLL